MCSGRHRGARCIEEGGAAMADPACAVLLIGGFLVLALTLRGLERL
ncbi:hypothetical protein [Saccharopolyspora gloriosae]|nr:hypothetical protein [Saccharopolyspora gloriosae]